MSKVILSIRYRGPLLVGDVDDEARALRQSDLHYSCLTLFRFPSQSLCGEVNRDLVKKERSRGTHRNFGGQVGFSIDKQIKRRASLDALVDPEGSRQRDADAGVGWSTSSAATRLYGAVLLMTMTH